MTGWQTAGSPKPQQLCINRQYSTLCATGLGPTCARGQDLNLGRIWYRENPALAQKSLMFGVCHPDGPWGPLLCRPAPVQVVVLLPAWRRSYGSGYCEKEPPTGTRTRRYSTVQYSTIEYSSSTMEEH